MAEERCARTVLKEAEKALHYSEERLSLILQASATGTFEVNILTGEGRWNDTEFELLGLQPGTVTPGPETFFRLVHPDDLTFLRVAWDKAIRSGSFDAEFRILRPDGEVRWLAGKGGFVYDGKGEGEGGGQALSFLGVNFDITARKVAEEASRQNEGLYRAIGESIDYGVWICAPDGRNIYASDSFLRLVGLTQKECSAFGWGDVLHPDDAERTIATWKECVRTQGHWDIEHRFRGVDGQWHPILARGVPVRDKEGALTCWAGINLDIGRLKAAEEAVRTNEERLQLALDAAHLATWDWDISSGKIIWNSEHYRILGYEPDSFSPTYDCWASRVHPADLAATEGRIQQAMEQGDEYRSEFRVLLPDGTVRWLEALGRFERDQAGKSIRLYGVMGDITERKMIVEELHHAKEALEKRVEERTEELVRLNIQLKQEIDERKQAEEERLNLERQLLQAQKMESLGILSGGIAHDFNNILAVIIGRCGLLKLRPDKIEDNVTQIEKAADRAAELCRQMLAYAGKAQYRLTPLLITVLVDEMVRMLQVTIPQNVLLKADFPAAIPLIKADDSQLRQVIMNLILNAVEAIGVAQGEVRLSLAMTEVREGERRWDHLGQMIPAGDYVCLEVIDNGSGMDEAIRRRIFEPFFTTKFSGRGLGLSATLGILTAHQAFLQVESQPGKGATFKVFFPVQRSEQPAVTGNQQEEKTSWKGKGTILLVEDEEQVRMIAGSFLESMGFTVIAAINGAEALAAYEKNAGVITLVMTDLGMPVMDGYALIRELWRLNPELPVIISSGYGDADVASRTTEENIAAIICKPYKFDELQRVVKSVVEKKYGVSP